LEGLLEIVSLEEATKSVGLVHIRSTGRSEFQILGDATLKLWETNEVQTDRIESRLAFDTSDHK